MRKQTTMCDSCGWLMTTDVGRPQRCAACEAPFTRFREHGDGRRGFAVGETQATALGAVVLLGAVVVGALAWLGLVHWISTRGWF